MSAALKLNPEEEKLSRKPPLGEKRPKLRLVWENPELSRGVQKEKPEVKPDSSYGRVLYNYFRDYDPSTGRYIQSDPIGLEGGANRFVYVGADPISYYDPDGAKKRKKYHCVLLNLIAHKLFCDRPHKCTFENKDCLDLKRRRAICNRCLAMRKAVQFCWGNRGSHTWKKHQERINETKRGCEKCERVIAKNCSRKMKCVF